MMAPVLNATLTRRTAHGNALCLLTFAADGGPLQFTPGQFLNVGLPGPDGRFITRAYSVGSAPGRPDAEFAISRVEGGALSPRLCDLQPGARAYVEPAPAGTFTLRDVPPGAPLLVVATGTGTAPFVSMLRAGLWAGRQVTVVHGSRTSEGLAFSDVLRDAPAVTYRPVLSREDAPGIPRGRVQQVLEAVAPTPDGTHALLCGNPQMIQEVRAWLEARGFRKHRKREPGNLHMEAYW